MPTWHFAYGAANAGWLPIAGDWNGPAVAVAGGRWRSGCCRRTAPLTESASAADCPRSHRPLGSRRLGCYRSCETPQVQFVISDLPGSYLGEAEGNLIYIDSNAAGHGWFVDPTPALDEEFTPSNQQLRAVDPRAVDRIDLLTVVEHELGHIAGLGDLDASVNDLMSGLLGTGIRRNASHQDAIDAALASQQPLGTCIVPGHWACPGFSCGFCPTAILLAMRSFCFLRNIIPFCHLWRRCSCNLAFCCRVRSCLRVKPTVFALHGDSQPGRLA